MEDPRVERLYALSLYEASSDMGLVRETAEEIAELARLLKDNPDFLKLLMTPTLDKGSRKAIAEETLGSAVSGLSLNFIRVLIDKGRIAAFTGIAKSFEDIIWEHDGITKGEALSALPLPEEQLRKLEEQTGRLLSKRVSLTNAVDAELIGGVVIYIDGKMIDASVRGRLASMRESIG